MVLSAEGQLCGLASPGLSTCAPLLCSMPRAAAAALTRVGTAFFSPFFSSVLFSSPDFCLASVYSLEFSPRGSIRWELLVPANRNDLSAGSDFGQGSSSMFSGYRCQAQWMLLERIKESLV